jgi:hypothetical protein
MERDGTMPTIPERRPAFLSAGPDARGGLLGVLREFLYGMAGYEFARQAIEMRTSLETIFMVSVVGDMVGLPVLPPYYSLRLLPFVVPDIATWRRRVLREREVSDTHEFHLHGV